MYNRKKRGFIAYKSLGNKKGLSAIVTNLLIILLVVVAIGVIWVVIRNVINKGSSDIELGRFTFDISVESAYVNGSDIVVRIRRNVGGGADLLGINLIFTNETDSIIIKKREFIKETERRIFTFSSTELPGIGAGDKVSVAPIYDSSGEEKTGEPTDSAIISGTPPVGGDGGGGGSGGSGGGGSGGTGGGNCGNGIINSGEQCDGTNLGGQTCTGLGFVGGTLSCTSGCQFDTSQCVGATPASCNGTWDGSSEDTGVQCDGTPRPHGCSENCVCKKGFTADGVGGCTLNPPLNSGVIFSIWPSGAVKYFDSEDLPTNSATILSYIGDYVNFSNSAENGCFLITYAEYLEINGRSYLRTEFVVNISAGENYKVWEAANCGQ